MTLSTSPPRPCLSKLKETETRQLAKGVLPRIGSRLVSVEAAIGHESGAAILVMGKVRRLLLFGNWITHALTVYDPCTPFAISLQGIRARPGTLFSNRCHSPPRGPSVRVSRIWPWIGRFPLCSPLFQPYSGLLEPHVTTHESRRAQKPT